MAIVRMTFMAGLPGNQELCEREAQTVEPLVAHDADVSLVSFLDAQLRADVVIERVDLHVPGAGVRHVEPDAAGAGAVADVEDAVALWIDAQLEDVLALRVRRPQHAIAVQHRPAAFRALQHDQPRVSGRHPQGRALYAIPVDGHLAGTADRVDFAGGLARLVVDFDDASDIRRPDARRGRTVVVA